MKIQNTDEGADASALTVRDVETAIKSLYAFGQQPSSLDVQTKVLDPIERVSDERLRTVMFSTAKINLARKFNDLIVASRHRSFAAHNKDIQPK